MTLLPIVDRELRAAARRKSTYRIRRWTALIGILLGLVFLFLVMVSGAGRTGKVLFNVLTAFAGGLCLLTGVFLTADCLSEEKREGTLGLLFLTDLKGYDVVLGKFAANSINAFYGLLALLPVMAVSLLLGGVTGGEFWRTTLALLNSLFISLAVGTCVSACGRDSRSTLALTFLVMLLLTVLVPLFFAFAAKAGFLEEWSSLGWISPYAPFSLASDAAQFRHARQFWEALLTSNLLGWFFLISASWALPRSWQETMESSRTVSFWQRSFSLRTRQRTSSGTARPGLVDLNPIAWLVGNERGMTRLAWAIVIGWGVVAVSASLVNPENPMTLLRPSKVAGFLLKLLVAVQAPRFFAETRQTGALELLLSTPLRTREVLQGQWLALRRIFFWPLTVYLLLNLAPLVVLPFQHLNHGSHSIPSTILGAAGSLIGLAWLTAGLVADVAAAGWLGMWLGLTTKKPNLASAMTVLFVLILPSVGFCGVDLLVDILLVSWAATRLNSDLRWLLNQSTQPSREVLLRHLSSQRGESPPVIAAL